MPQAEGPPGNMMFCVKFVHSTHAVLQSQGTAFSGEAVGRAVAQRGLGPFGCSAWPGVAAGASRPVGVGS